MSLIRTPLVVPTSTKPCNNLQSTNNLSVNPPTAPSVINNPTADPIDVVTPIATSATVKTGPKNGLPAGAFLGIATAILAVILGVLIACFMWIRRRRITKEMRPGNLGIGADPLRSSSNVPDNFSSSAMKWGQQGSTAGPMDRGQIASIVQPMRVYRGCVKSILVGSLRSRSRNSSNSIGSEAEDPFHDPQNLNCKINTKN